MIQVLLVDDDELTRGLCAGALEDAGYRVTEVSSARVAIALLRTTRYEVLITDVMMPDMDGLELIRAVRGFDTDVNIIAITGGGAQFGFDFLPYAGAFGADAGLMKPFSADEILDVIASCLSQPGGATSTAEPSHRSFFPV